MVGGLIAWSVGLIFDWVFWVGFVPERDDLLLAGPDVGGVAPISTEVIVESPDKLRVDARPDGDWRYRMYRSKCYHPADCHFTIVHLKTWM